MTDQSSNEAGANTNADVEAEIDSTTDTDFDSVNGESNSSKLSAIVAGPDEEDVGVALEERGVTVTRIDGVLTRPMLEEAGIVDVNLYVLTDLDQATTIPIVRDLTDDLRTVIYARGSIPEFVRGQLDLAIDPRLIDPAVLAEELSR